MATLDPSPPPQTKISHEIEQALPPPPPPAILSAEEGDDEEGVARDPGVSNEAWMKLQAARRAEQQARKEAEERLRLLEKETREADKKREEAERALKKANDDLNAAKNPNERNDLMRLREQERLRHIALKEEQARIAERLEQERKEEEQRRKEEAKVQAKIRSMGICPAGYRWIKMGDGYRCGGGAHFLSNGELGI